MTAVAPAAMALVFGACSEERIGHFRALSSLDLEEHEVEISLVDYFPVADVRPPLVDITFDHFCQRLC